MADPNEVTKLEGTNEGEQNAAPQDVQKKKGIIVRGCDAVHRAYIQARATKGGRVVLKMTKWAALGLGLWKFGEYEFRRGQASVGQMTVNVQGGETEEEPSTENEAPAEEETAAE